MKFKPLHLDSFLRDMQTFCSFLGHGSADVSTAPVFNTVVEPEQPCHLCSSSRHAEGDEKGPLGTH